MMHAFPVVKRFLNKSLMVALLLLLPLWAGLANAANTTLLVMGDSLSAAYGIERQAGWVSLLSQRLGDEVKVVNASISGETTSGGVSRLHELLRQHGPDIVLIELGGNDGLRGLPPKQMRHNLSTMIEASKKIDAKVLLVGIEIPPNYGQAYTQAFKTVYHDLAEQYDVPLVPFLLEGIALEDDLMQDDGIHPTAEAQPRMLENVWPKLEALLPEKAQERVASH
ncbi:arylesterase [Halomonas sp. PR-M31]|uniref:arylesterase n=1 Tax=Halomonas sp. PR-M31 TaxID=1471202 RepID=UPI000651E5DE|nr:arylesterase [Halomonas sp. PR-M31]